MRERGTMAGFFIGKTVLAVAVVGLLGATVSMGASLKRQNSGEELEVVAESISSALKDAGRLPGNVEMERDIPEISRDVEVEVSGSWSGGIQTIVVRLRGETYVEKTFAIGYRVNGGEFTLSASDPASVRVSKFERRLKFSDLIDFVMLISSENFWKNPTLSPELILEVA